MREIDPLVFEYQHDRHRSREAEALLVLRKVASLVKPIMRQRNWKVGTLSEFYPQQRNLLGLNVNAGQKICLRLRYASDERQFLPLEHVVDTMLHELCHIVHGPHNKDFHALWNQLRDEHEELVIKGYTGEGFLSEGNRLGGRRMPVDEARRVARAAAERRRTLSAGSGQKLGGAPLLKGSDVRRVIADAAQRRIDVTKGCASGSTEGEKLAEEASRNGFRTKAEEDDANERAIMEAYIEMVQEDERAKWGSLYVPPSQRNPAGPRSNVYPNAPPIPEHSKPRRQLISTTRTLSDSTPKNTDKTNDDESDNAQWSCPTCTLDNPPTYLCCDACGSERPAPSLTTQSRLVQSSAPSTAKRRLSKSQNNASSDSSSSRVLSFKKDTSETVAARENSRSKRPLGWLCHVCGAFMETEWWTCSACGTMKAES